MKHIQILAIAVIAVIATGCTTYSYTSRSVSIAQPMEVQPTPTLVDVKPDFNKRINETSSWCKSTAEAMGEVKYKAINNNNIDIVVDPIYKVATRGRKCQVLLTGFAGYYTNPRSMMENINQLKDVDKAEIEKYLILQQNPQIIQYLYDNKDGNVVTINHNSKCAPCPHKGEIAPTTPAIPAVSTPKGKK